MRTWPTLERCSGSGQWPDSRIRVVLQQALPGNHPFRRFKDAINSFPKELDRWFAYESIRRRGYIEEWARDEGIEIDFSG